MRAFAVFLAVLAMIPSAQALTAPNVTFIPPQFSANSSFLAIAQITFADRSSPLRVLWQVPGLNGGFGSFPKDGDKFICYFSSKDTSATCGPTPFTRVGIFTFGMGSVNHLDNFIAPLSNTISVDVGDIGLTHVIDILDRTIIMDVVSVGSPIADSISYAVYYENATPMTPFIDLVKDIPSQRFKGNITLPGGDYYIAFSASSSPGSSGGDLVRVSIPKPLTETVCPGPIPVAGGYPLKTDNVDFRGILIDKNEHFEQAGLKITNVGNETITGLTFAVPANLSSILSISLADSTLEPNDTVFYTLKLDNIRDSVTINALVDLKSGLEVVGQISVFIPVSVVGGITSCPSTGLFLEPMVWTGDFILGPATKTFTLTNNQDSTLGGIDYSATGDLAGITEAIHPSFLSGKEAGTIEVTLNPASSGTYQGTVNIETDSGSQAIVVNVNFYDDITSQLDTLKSNWDSLKETYTPDQLLTFSETIQSVDDAIDSAESSFSFGDYRKAELEFIGAQSQFNTLSGLGGYQPPPQPGEGGDFTTVIIAAVALIGLVVAFFFIRKRKGRGMEQELEEEFEEEMK